MLLNSPHNPTGKVFTAGELELIAELCAEHDAYAVTDEVYEHLVFTDAAAAHIPLATLPGMRQRTVRISSAGKTFSCTGWKIGWACGPADAGVRGDAGQAVPHLRQRGAVPARGGGGARAARRATTPRSATACRPAATSWSAG